MHSACKVCNIGYPVFSIIVYETRYLTCFWGQFGVCPSICRLLYIYMVRVSAEWCWLHFGVGVGAARGCRGGCNCMMMLSQPTNRSGLARKDALHPLVRSYIPQNRTLLCNYYPYTRLSYMEHITNEVYFTIMTYWFF